MTHTIYHFGKKGVQTRSARLVSNIETKFGEVFVYDWGDDEYVVNLEETTMSIYNYNDPTKITSEYISKIAQIWDEEKNYNSILHLGVAGGTLARYIARNYPDTTQVGVEINEELINLMRKDFSLPKSPKLKVRFNDASKEIYNFKNNSFDMIVVDIFDKDALIPKGIRTTSFFEEALMKLTKNGKIVINVIADKYTRKELNDLIGILPESSKNNIVNINMSDKIDEWNYLLIVENN